MTVKATPRDVRNASIRATPAIISLTQFIDDHVAPNLVDWHKAKLFDLVEEYGKSEFRKGFMEAPRHDYR